MARAPSPDCRLTALVIFVIPRFVVPRFDMLTEQVLAADRIIRTIKHYGLLGNIEDAHYMMYALDVARRAGLAPDRTPIKDSKLATANIMVRTAASRRIAMVGDSISGRLGLSGGPVYSSETKSLKQGKTVGVINDEQDRQREGGLSRIENEHGGSKTHEMS